MAHIREELDQLTAGYISDTMSCIHTVQEFCDRHSKWLLQRETELEMMRDITDRAEMINLTTDHFRNSEDKKKAFGEFMWSKVTQVTAGKRAQKLEEELGCLLQDTLKGLEKLTLFLEAVEMLAVTSLSVFEEENPVCQLPEGLVNVDLLAFQLDKYLRVSQELCEKLQKSDALFIVTPANFKWLYQKNKMEYEASIVRSSGSISFLGMNYRTKKAPCPNLTNEAIQNMYEHLTHLRSIRLDQHFRMTYLFRGSAQRFIGLFSLRRSRMQQFLVALEEEAVQLDRMKMGASISSVAGSSVGFAGGIVSIVGLALAPFTAGASLTLTMVGVGLGVTSGVNSLATGITELSVNTHHGKKINEIFQSYFEDVETMLECLEQAARCIIPNTVPDVLDVATGVVTLAKTTGGVAKGIDVLVDCASAVKVVRAEEVASSTVKVVTQEVKAARNVPNMAADLTDIGQLAKGTPLALSKSARAGFIALNSIFMGVDLFFICKDSISLANGGKSDVSKVIRGRASLWKTELDAWEKIHRSLCIGIWRFRRSKEVLRRPFYT